MRRTRGKNVMISTDNEGGLFSVDWRCLYCVDYNAGFYFANNPKHNLLD